MLAELHSLWDLCSWTRDQTGSTAVKAQVLTNSPPGNSPGQTILIDQNQIQLMITKNECFWVGFPLHTYRAKD